MAVSTQPASALKMSTSGSREVADPPLVLRAGEISARLDRLPPTRTVWKLIALLALGNFFEAYDLLFTGYIGPGLIRSGIMTATTPGLFGMTGFAGFVAALFSGLFVGTLACGFLADRYGRRAIFTYSLLWYCGANLIMCFQSTASAINFWRFIAGMGLGVELITICTYVSELAPKQIRGRAFALIQTVGFTAVPVVAFVSYLLVPIDPFGWDGWRWVVVLGCVGATFVWFIRRALPESPRWLAMKGRLQEADRILSDLERKVANEYGAKLPPPAPAEPVVPHGRFAEIWVPPYRNRAIMMIIFNIFQTIGYYGFANWVPTLLIKQGITTSTSLGYTTLIALAAPVGPLLGMLIADRLERKHVIVAMAAVNIICGLLFSQASSTEAIIALGVSLTLSGNIISYSYHAYQQEVFPTGIRARATGFVYSWSRFSAILNAFFIAFTLQHFGVVGVFLLIGGAMAIVMLAIGLMGPRTRGLELEKISH